MAFDIPILINVRDRISDLRRLVKWLEDAGHQRITLLDNDSTFPPLLDYLEATPHEVIEFGRNVGARSLWDLDMAPDEFYVFTDPDLVPLDECPLDAVAHLHEILQRHPEFVKAGLGLHLADVPLDMPSLAWEAGTSIRGRELEPGAYASLIDTTFALHRPGAPFTVTAIRTSYPYEVRHTSWYLREPLDDEHNHYIGRAATGPTGSTWASILRQP